MNPAIAQYPAGAIDCHLHTRHSCDADMDPRDAVAAAVQRGLKALVFTEHMDFDPSDEGYGFYDRNAIDGYLDEIGNRQSAIRIFKGVEITYQPQYEDDIRAFIAQGGFDLVIGSVHMVGQDDISRAERQGQFYGARPEAEAYGLYYDELRRMAASRLFDAAGHFDLCKKYGFDHYGPMDWANYREQIQGILRLMVHTGLHLEINTSGLRQTPREAYPGWGVVEEYLRLGGTSLILGSDAHRPEHVGFNFPETADQLQSLVLKLGPTARPS